MQVTGAAFELHAHNTDYFRAVLRHRGLTAEALVSSYQSLGLPEFFAGMARDWKGWSGERSWASFETELSLTATSDRTGHVSLVTELRGGAYPNGWTARATMVLEAGQLDRLAAEAAAFERSSIRAT